MKQNKTYIEFLAYSLSTDKELPDSIVDINWMDLLRWGQQQAIVGLLWQGMQQAFGTATSADAITCNKPTDDDVMEWMAEVNKITKRNQTVDKKAAWVSRNFDTEGFYNCVLKGQGNALLYPSPSLRTPGDIDIWVMPKDASTQEEAVEKVISYVQRFCPDGKPSYHHIDFLKAGDVEVEVHYRPSWLYSRKYNRKLQQYFMDHREDQFRHTSSKGFQYPTLEFNIVYQLCHVQQHLMKEGIGFRQLIDYYYLLSAAELSSEAESELRSTICGLGLRRISEGVSWVMAEVLGLDEDNLISPKNEHVGRFILNEILRGGNFGFHDENHVVASDGTFLHNIQRLIRDLRLALYFPRESFCEPFFRIWHWKWRKAHRGEISTAKH